MKVRPLILDEAAKADIARVVKFAEARRLSIHDLHDIVGKKVASPGDDPNYRCVVRVGYLCVFTVEQQPMGWVRHLSISVLGDGVAPNEAAVAMLAEAFGFKFKDWSTSTVSKGVSVTRLKTEEVEKALRTLDNVYTEDIGPNKIAVNLMQLLD